MVSYNLGHVKGADGKGITSITKTGTSGLVDTYTILFTDNTTTTFTVTNGQDGSGGADIVTSWETTLSDEKIPSEKLTKNTIDGKADSNHSHGAIDKDGKIGSTSGKPVITGTGGAVTTGAFGTSSGQFAEGNHTHSGYASSTHTHGNISNDGKVGTTSGKPLITGSDGAVTAGAFGTSSGQFAEGNHTHSGYVSATKVTSWSSTVSDSNVPSEKLVKDSLDAKLSATKVTSWSGTTSDSNVPSEKLVKDTIDALEDLIGDAIDYINL